MHFRYLVAFTHSSDLCQKENLIIWLSHWALLIHGVMTSYWHGRSKAACSLCLDSRKPATTPTTLRLSFCEGNNTYTIIAEILTTNTIYTKYLYVPPHSPTNMSAHGSVWLFLTNELGVELMLANSELKHSESLHGPRSHSFLASQTWNICVPDAIVVG